MAFHSGLVAGVVFFLAEGCFLTALWVVGATASTLDGLMLRLSADEACLPARRGTVAAADSNLGVEERLVCSGLTLFGLGDNVVKSSMFSCCDALLKV